MSDKPYVLFQGDCLEVMKDLPDGSIDLVVTSPPYDNLRTYNGSLEWSFEIFQNIALELKRVLKPGGVIVWVVGDVTVKGSETGTSFKQALYFKEIGLNIHDTMIYHKLAPPLTHNRYEQHFEYMFVLCKDKLKNFNGIREDKTWFDKRTTKGFVREKDGSRDIGAPSACLTKLKGNVWHYEIGGGKMGASKEAHSHPAIFPLQLAIDHIISWSNEGDVVLDPFLGSGTTGVAAINLNRMFIGIEKEPKYYEIAEKRINEADGMVDTVNCHVSAETMEELIPKGLIEMEKQKKEYDDFLKSWDEG